MRHRWLAYGGHVLFGTLALSCMATAIRADDATKPAPVAGKLTVPTAFTKATPSGLSDLQAMQGHVEKLSALLKECTVSVQIGRAQGSGVIVTPDGYVLTCAHVVGAPHRNCRVIFPDGTRKSAETLGSNRMLDAGLMKITAEAPPGGWPYAEMADYAAIAVGDWCLATGHPGGFQEDRLPVVRLGRVIFISQRVLQSDCELVGGDSGGPLFDMQGRVIAINSRIQDDPAANYHVPVSAYQHGWDRLQAGEQFSSHSGALLGVSGRGTAEGIHLTQVYPGEPAEAAGLFVGDTLVTFDSQRVTTLTRLTELVGEKNPGAVVSLDILRDGQPMTIRVRLGMRWD